MVWISQITVSALQAVGSKAKQERVSIAHSPRAAHPGPHCEPTNEPCAFSNASDGHCWAFVAASAAEHSRAERALCAPKAQVEIAVGQQLGEADVLLLAEEESAVDHGLKRRPWRAEGVVSRHLITQHRAVPGADTQFIPVEGQRLHANTRLERKAVKLLLCQIKPV